MTSFEESSTRLNTFFIRKDLFKSYNGKFTLNDIEIKPGNLEKPIYTVSLSLQSLIKPNNEPLRTPTSVDVENIGKFLDLLSDKLEAAGVIKTPLKIMEKLTENGIDLNNLQRDKKFGITLDHNENLVVTTTEAKLAAEPKAKPAPTKNIPKATTNNNGAKTVITPALEQKILETNKDLLQPRNISKPVVEPVKETEPTPPSEEPKPPLPEKKLRLADTFQKRRDYPYVPKHLREQPPVETEICIEKKEKTFKGTIEDSNTELQKKMNDIATAKRTGAVIKIESINITHDEDAGSKTLSLEYTAGKDDPTKISASIDFPEHYDNPTIFKNLKSKFNTIDGGSVLLPQLEKAYFQFKANSLYK